MLKRCKGCDERYHMNELRCGKFCEKCVVQIINEFTTLLTDNFTEEELTVINDCLDCTTCRIENVNIQVEK